MAGRKTMVATIKDVVPINKARADFYIVMREIQDDETAQKDGLIAIAYEVGVTFAQQSHFIRNLIPEVYQCLPFKFTCFHYCYSNPALKASFGFFFNFVKKVIGARFREHYGNHVEAQVRQRNYMFLLFAIL